MIGSQQSPNFFPDFQGQSSSLFIVAVFYQKTVSSDNRFSLLPLTSASGWSVRRRAAAGECGIIPI
jgi:hypothetical protein